MADNKPKPKPIESDPGKQHDDNVDDLGRKTDGTTIDQPTGTKPSKS